MTVMGTTKELEAEGSLAAKGTVAVELSVLDQHTADKRNGKSPRDAASVAYFGIALGSGMSTCDDDELPLVFVDRALALRCVKKYRGARFKAFASREEAAMFSLQPAAASSETSETSEASVVVSGERSSSYRTPKSQDLVQLRKAIEAGDAVTFRQTVWSNPRYLIGVGDTPAILQEGSRYNALHVACIKKQPALAQLLLDTLHDQRFMELLYPDDSPEVRSRRTAFVLDLYLNTPDKAVRSYVHSCTSSSCFLLLCFYLTAALAQACYPTSV